MTFNYFDISSTFWPFDTRPVTHRSHSTCVSVCMFLTAPEQRRMGRSQRNLAAWLIPSSFSVRSSFSPIALSVAMATAKNLIFERQWVLWAPFSQHLGPKSQICCDKICAISSAFERTHLHVSIPKTVGRVPN